MHDVLSETIDELLLSDTRLTLLENDEFMFWAKLAFFLFSSQSNNIKVRPTIEIQSVKPEAWSVL